MSYLPAEVKSNLSELSEHLDSLEQQLEMLLAHESLAALNAELPAADALKVNTAVAYTLHALYYTFLRTQGQDPADHPVKKELERVKQYVGKVTKALANEPQPQVRIDTEAAGRMVNAQLRGSTPMPKAAHLHWKEDLGKILGRTKP
jgi:exosome complex protein LRP1